MSLRNLSPQRAAFGGRGCQARHSYLAHEIAWGHRFQDMMRDLPDGRRLLDYRYFHEIVPLQQSPLAASSRSEVSISPSGSP
ncbi:MAG: hypothetical protein ACFCU9_04300 [Cyanophyceae cyanobacterium]